MNKKNTSTSNAYSLKRKRFDQSYSNTYTALIFLLYYKAKFEQTLK